MKKALTVLAVAAVALGGIGFIATSQSASAQEATTAVRPPDPIGGVLDQLVEDETITADQATAIRDAFVAEAPFGGQRGVRGPGHPQAGLETVAGVLGMSVDELIAELQSGRSIADIAGTDLPAVASALVGEANARIDQAVADGRIDAAKAADAKAAAAERIDAMVNGDTPCLDGGAFGERGGHMGDGPMGGGRMGGGFGTGTMFGTGA